jgi:uridine kinase
MRFGELAARIRALDDRAMDLSDPASPRPLPGRRCRVVGIDGLSGSGKSSFASRLAYELNAPVLSVDDLVPGWDALALVPGLLADGVLRPLAAGRPGRYRRYDWLTDQLTDWVDLAPGDLLIVEGCCAGVPPAGGLLSFLIWLDAPAGERWQRLELRPDWPAYAPFAEEWASQETALQATADTTGRADLVVDNSAKHADEDWPDTFTVRTGRP